MSRTWQNVTTIASRSYVCGHCGSLVGSASGFFVSSNGKPNHRSTSRIYICPNCTEPSLLREDGSLIPGVPFGSPVQHVPTNVNDLYEEARRCTASGCFTATVLLCRKILMHIGVEQGAQPGLQFIKYVEYLAQNGFVPPNGRHWVDHIRNKGNEANHEICVMCDSDAKDLIKFIEMLLRFIYEFPQSVPP